ncbi:MAG: PIN domain-containing protein [Rhizomicrobium sp.]
MRAPASTIVLDTTVLISAVLGRTDAVIQRVQQTAALVTTSRVVEEARRKIELGLKAPELLPQLDAIAATLAIVPVSRLAAFLADAEAVLRDAVPSRNGSARDAHVLALAWSTGADIWSADRDFAGTGVPSWSTINLVRALTEAGG